jgi:uncharacterized protein YabE (DUF348 family)
MDASIRFAQKRIVKCAGAVLVALLAVFFVDLPQPTKAESERVITIHHDGTQETVVTDAKTIGEALKRAEVDVHDHDVVEPAANFELIAAGYDVNVYRARPITIVDGAKAYQIMSARTSAKQIASDAGLTLHDEDGFKLTRIDDFVTEGGVGLKLSIQRATPVTLDLYGKTVAARTLSKTVGGLLKEKGVVLGVNEGVNVALETPITQNMSVQVWRNGVQTITVEQEVNFPVKQIRDTNRPVGFKDVQTPGVKGKRAVTYEIEMRNGIEVARKEIQSVAIEQPKEQVEVIGAKPNAGALSKSKGVNTFVDSKGVAHRETYYDLQMNGVMRNCGGTYSVRADGAKVDQDGFVLVAANLNRYPRCSVVETSLGLGKVYDTGGFATVHPDGFDLATDWSNNDGR